MWVKLNDQAPNDPDIDALSDGAFRLWITAICYCQAVGWGAQMKTAPAGNRGLTAKTVEES